MKKTFFILIIFAILSGCGGETNIMPVTEESKLIIDEERSVITFYVLLENENRNAVGPLYAKFIIYDETLQDAIGYEVIDFSNDYGEPQAFALDGRSTFFIAESFIYNAELDNEELVNEVEVVISDENGMELIQFLIPNVELHP